MSGTLGRIATRRQPLPRLQVPSGSGPRPVPRPTAPGGATPSGGAGAGSPPLGKGGFYTPFKPSRAPVTPRGLPDIWAPPPVADLDPIFTTECLRKALEAYGEERYYQTGASVMGLDSNTPPQPKTGDPRTDHCSNFGIVMAQWELSLNLKQVSKEEFKQRVAAFKSAAPFLIDPALWSSV